MQTGAVLAQLASPEFGAAQADAAVHAQAAHASYAGDADPYKHPREDDDSE